MLTAFCCSHPVSFSVFGDADGRYSKYSSWSLKISAYKLPSKLLLRIQVPLRSRCATCFYTIRRLEVLVMPEHAFNRNCFRRGEKTTKTLFWICSLLFSSLGLGWLNWMRYKILWECLRIPYRTRTTTSNWTVTSAAWQGRHIVYIVYDSKALLSAPRHDTKLGWGVAGGVKNLREREAHLELLWLYWTKLLHAFALSDFPQFSRCTLL